MPTATLPTRETIGARVRQAREHAHVTQEDLARRLGIPRPSVSEIEAGRRDLSSVELASIAEFLGKPLDWFVASGGGFEPDAWNPERFRLRGGELTEPDRRRLLEFAQRSLQYAQLEEILGIRPGAHIPPPRYEGLTGRHIDQGKSVAIAERQRLKLGTQPIGDVVSLLEQQGVKVLDWSMALGSRIDGALFRSAETGPCVLLNESATAARRQFTAAHEFAHLLLDMDGDQAEVCFGVGASLPEKRANAFAAEFLSPSEGVLEFLEGRGVPARRSVAVADVVGLQRYFNLSYDATLWRLLNLGLIDNATRDELAAFRPSALAQRLGFKVDEPRQEQVSSGRFVNLALRAWNAGKITKGKLAELLDLEKSDLVDLAATVASLGAA